jgi:hypothetical protein
MRILKINAAFTALIYTINMVYPMSDSKNFNNCYYQIDRLANRNPLGATPKFL